MPFHHTPLSVPATVIEGRRGRLVPARFATVNSLGQVVGRFAYLIDALNSGRHYGITVKRVGEAEAFSAALADAIVTAHTDRLTECSA